MCRRYVFFLITGVILLGIGLAGCNTGESDAMRAIRINSEGTIAALGNQIRTLEATMTSVGTLTVRIDALQIQLEAEQQKNTQLLAQQNGGGGAPLPTVPAGGQTQPVIDPNLPAATPNAGGPPTAIPTAGGVVIEKVVTARGVNRADGCAASEVTTFSAGDAQIWAVARVRNMPRGVNFVARWQVGGTEPREFTYTSDFSATTTCINFYIEPRTLSVAPGDYSVTITAPESVPAPAAIFKVQ